MYTARALSLSLTAFTRTHAHVGFDAAMPATKTHADVC